MRLLTESELNFERPVEKAAGKGSKKLSCLNVGHYHCQFKMQVVPSLGIISRVMLAFNKRGLVIQGLDFRQLECGERAAIQVRFAADAEQVRLVRHDLAKLYDLVQLTAVLEEDQSQA